MSTNQFTGCLIRWIGLANVRPQVENNLLGTAKGAFVAVVGDAEGISSFLEIVESEFRTLQFEVLSLEDIEPLRRRIMRQELPIELDTAIAKISDRSPVAFGSFHAYEE